MKCLFLDTSSFYIRVAIATEDEIMYQHTELNDTKVSERIFDIIEDVFDKAKMMPNEIKKIFVVNGPGSFTGIRIALTIGKTYAYSLGLDLITISTLELMCSGSNSNKNMAIIEDRNGYVYAGAYSKLGEIIFDDSYIELKNLIPQMDMDYKVYSYDTFNEINTEIPEVDILKLIDRHIDNSVDNIHLAIPNYIKLTDAEKNLND